MGNECSNLCAGENAEKQDKQKSTEKFDQNQVLHEVRGDQMMFSNSFKIMHDFYL